MQALRRHVALWALVGVATSLTTGAALADPESELPREVGHDLTIHLSPGHAELHVRRKWQNDGPTTELTTALPLASSEGVLGGFRAQSSRGGWRPSLLLPRDAAQTAFEGSGPEGGDAVLVELWSGNAPALTLLPFLGGTSRTVEYQVSVPLSYEHGAHRLYNPGLAVDQGLRPRVRVVAKGGETVLVDGEPLASKLVNGELDGYALELVPKNVPPLSGALAFIALDGDRRALRYRIEAAPRLSEPPKNVHVVFVLDASRSLSESERAGMLGAARAYLSHVPDAKVDLVTFHRRAQSLFGRFESSVTASSVLAGLTLDGKNGSNVDAALALARQRLAGAPKNAAKRVVLFTDALTRASLDDKQLGLASVGGLLHLALPEDGRFDLERDDLHPWAPNVEATGGVVWKAPVDSDPTTFAEVYEELVRPMRIHRARLSVPSAPALESEIGATLREGSGLSGIALATDTDPRVDLFGVLWAKPTRVTLNPSLQETRLWKGLLLGSPLADELTADEVRRLALEAGVLSKETSFVATSPGRRSGHRSIGLGNIGWSSRCGGAFGGGGIHRGPPFSVEHSQLWLEEQLNDAVAQCGGAPPVEVVVETTRDEIVDVSVTGGGAPACVTIALWDLEPPAGFAAHAPHATFTIAAPAASP